MGMKTSDGNFSSEPQAGGTSMDDDLAFRTPTPVKSRFARELPRRSVDLSKRDGFPLGFGSRRAVAAREDAEADASSRSMGVYFDSEQMDRGLVDDSPVYGSVGTELTPIELGSFNARDESDDDDDSDVVESARRLDATALSFSERRSVSSKRKKKKAEQQPITSQLHADFVLGGSKREPGFVSSRLYAKPLAAGRVSTSP